MTTNHPIPKPLSHWRHRRGGIYLVYDVANQPAKDADKFPLIVIYQDYKGQTWARPLSEWHQSFTEVTI